MSMCGTLARYRNVSLDILNVLDDFIFRTNLVIHMDKSSNGALFQDLQGDNQIPDVAELESLCMNCEENVRLSPISKPI